MAYELGHWELDIPPEDMPLCPLCDQPLFRGEEFVMGVVHHSMESVCCLVHLHCAQNEIEDEEEDEA